MRPPREPIVLRTAENGEVPPLHATFGFMVFGPPEWALQVYLGRWIIGIERAREED